MDEQLYQQMDGGKENMEQQDGKVDEPWDHEVDDLVAWTHKLDEDTLWVSVCIYGHDIEGDAKALDESDS